MIDNFKSIRLISTILLICASSLLSAQTEERPWFFGLGFNAVDYQTSTPSEVNTHFSALRLSAGRHLWGSFSLEASYALNTITDHPGLTDSELDHSAIDIMVFYSFRSLIYRQNDGLIDPYLGAGAGITWLENLSRTDDVQSNTLNGIAGVNFWVSPSLAIYGQGAYKNSTDDFADTYFEYAVGIRFNFSLQGSDVCFP